MSNFEDLNFTGEYIASHPEVRALESLIKKTLGNGSVNDDMFNEWIKNNVLGYNRNIVTSP